MILSRKEDCSSFPIALHRLRRSRCLWGTIGFLVFGAGMICTVLVSRLSSILNQL